MPVKNEALYLDRAIDSIQALEYPATKIEIIVVDGASTDATADVIKKRMRDDARITFIPGKYNCPQAMNAGLAVAKGSLIAKIDGHGYADKEFLKIAVSYLIAHPEYSCIGGEIVPLGTDVFALSNMFARFSKFGVGFGAYTSEKKIHPADSVQCGVYVREHLKRVGDFDDNLQFAEDEEANFRLTKAGYKIVYHPGMRYFYHNRPTFGALYKQYRNYGEARVNVLQKYPDFFRIKHIIPSALVVALLFGGVLCAIFNSLLIPVGAIYAIYLTFLTIGALLIGIENRFFRFHYLATSLLMLHFGYGIGMLQGLAKRRLTFQSAIARISRQTGLRRSLRRPPV
jgi:glycosyltransferase involved in cell wall biosynthesis